MRILIIEDERRLANVISKGLVSEGFAVDIAYNGAEGKYLIEVNDGEYDILILDVNLPKIDGLTLCRELRKNNNKTPILILSARSSLEDRVAGLDAGADDYLVKPFAFLELKSRINALIRRSKKEVAPILKIADLEVNPVTHEVFRAGKEIKLTPKEFSVLEFLLRNKSSVVTRTQLIEHVWDYNFDSLSNVVDVFVSSLRRKIDRGAKIKLIHTLHGVGYRISEK